MLTVLMDNIKNYILFLNKNGYYVSIHTSFSEYMLPLLDFNIHRHPHCLMVKSKNEEWNKCIDEHSGIRFQEGQTYIIYTCHAGLTEYIFKLNCGGSICVSSDDGTVEPMQIIPLLRMIEYLNVLCPKNDTEITENEIVNKALKFINRNFYNDVSNTAIANFCGCSVSSLCHLFKKHLNKGIHRYIVDQRLQYAKELLRISHVSVSAVSQKSGFSDYNYFTTRFKKEFHMSPTQYRNLCAAEETQI